MNPELLFSYANKQDQLVSLDKRSIFTILNVLKEITCNDIYFSINVFPSTLLDENFLHQLNEVISFTNIKPSSIVLEISEAEKKEHISSLNEICSQLKKQGFLIAIDDMGKGESTLRTIIELEPNIAKIDRYFAKDLFHSPKKQKVLRSLLHFFGDDTTLILEGFESEEDLKTAKDLGISFGQGFYLGKPLPIHYYLPNCRKV